jgi:hypothetical protein
LAGSHIFSLAGSVHFGGFSPTQFHVRRNSIGTDRRTTFRVYRGCDMTYKDNAKNGDDNI